MITKSAALTGQELRCVELACAYLANRCGGDWHIIDELDQAFPDVPSPEVVVSNGVISAAIEVKRLTGDAIQQAYGESIKSLETFLAPTCGGYYYVNPPVDLRLPIDRKLRKSLKVQVERVAPTLKVDETGVLRIPNSGYLVHRPGGPGYAHCLHDSGYSLLAPLGQRIDGEIFLIDGGLQHSFSSEAGKAAFIDVLEAAYRDGRFGSTERLVWDEEWELTRTRDDGDTGVWIICVTDARDVSSSVAECLDAMMGAAMRKFEDQRWADLHLIVLDCASGLMTAERVLPVLATYTQEELATISVVLFTDKDETHQAFANLEPLVERSFQNKSEFKP